ncbi:MAG: hypothetical protein Q8P24_08345 [Desulfobacterales bacterium]|nr:hypothetical protein [Desulfobacterales bacterium]
MKMKTFIALTVMAVGFISSAAEAKVISPSAEKGQNKVYIRADGLACYFCAYGLERFFKQSGRIAWYDMNMKDGVVEVGFIKGKPILPIQTINQYVYDAGFSPRTVKAEFVGRLTQTDGKYRFEVSETSQSFPVEANAVVKESQATLNQEITLIAGVKEDSTALMRLAPEQIVLRRSEP